MKIVAFFISLLLSSTFFGDHVYDSYKRAEKFHRKNLKKIIYNADLRPEWVKNKKLFWYKISSREGEKFYLISPEKKSKKLAFDHGKIALTLSKLLKKTIISSELPFNRISYSSDLKKIFFEIKKDKYECDLNSYRIIKIEKKKKDKNEKLSPDKKYIAFIRDHNLYIRSIKSKSEIKLTSDGSRMNSYGLSWDWYYKMNETDPSQTKKMNFGVFFWSPDSKKILTRRVDYRNAKKLYLYQSLPKKGFRANTWSYYRSLPGEKTGAQYSYYITDIIKRKTIRIKLKPLHNTISWGSPQWLKKSGKLQMLHYKRGYKSVLLSEIDSINGKVRTILEESSTTYIDTAKTEKIIFNEAREFVWSSERDGWNHLYLYDWKNGKLKNQITSGEFVVREIIHIDEKRRVIYFTASGKDEHIDPYLKQLYSVRLNGKGLKQLTNEPADHTIYLSPDKKHFVDKYSRVDLPTVTEMKRLKDGKTLMRLEKADIKDLLATGWRYPEAFSCKGRDGKTDIYGVIFRPSNFDPQKKYPLLDATYSGPQAVKTPKTFLRGALNSEQPIAELGFIVISIDGFGTANRSKKFHNYSYKNLQDIGAPDHIKAIKYLSEKYKFIDINRVGIYGHSAGGYDAAKGILKYPDFYKVAVSSAGNHDLRMAKAWWPEQYLGYPVGEYYNKQSNLTIAKNLKGKLMLAAGDMDNNVNPACTLRLAAELVKANKEFELLIIPNANHSSWYDPYFTRRMWDFLVRNLLDLKPPQNFKIKL